MPDLKTLLTAILLALPLLATAQVYKWTDENGQVHYGSQPPKQGQADRIKLRAAPPAPRQEKSEPTQAKDESGGEQRRTAAEKEAEAARRAQLQENCAIARKNLAVLQEPTHRRFRTDDGEITYFDDEQRQQRIDQAQAYIDENCA
ncbi:DUF4124 domain-containing protein [Alkalilimnicola sp. S0819]|uniref:DUF4124 domain-containing protein n=1 Tax=Alkalilimnicola sp. S0819 TaxID=2613922 RepID=UPI00126234F0|nr:DUF4124 domain-containing protein [Alkalilimnicola sp. S0819]KAB7623222.1 DUF4124 domain-containing protein [Alkalilimnicola sp. S0819]MPQ17071.1 DUF4124 domain-containing protein [Alkalilimnicola sp. S0819]